MEYAFDTPGAVRLRVTIGAGLIDVETAETDRTEIELVARGRGGKDLLDEMVVKADDRGGTHEIVVEQPKRWHIGLFRDSEVGVRIRCPHGAAVETQTGSADVTVRGRISSAHAKTASGDLSFPQVEGELVVSSASGDISGEEVGGDCVVKTASGDVEVRSVGGTFVGNLVSGDLRLQDARDSVTVATVSGDQWIGAVAAGEIRLQAVSGDVHVGVRPGLRLWIDATSVSGSMRSELDSAEAPTGDGPLVQLRARTVSGDVSIVRAVA
jgi:hypothetical protein